MVEAPGGSIAQAADRLVSEERQEICFRDKETAAAEKNDVFNRWRHRPGISALFRVRAADPSGGSWMQLKELVHHLTELIWQAEQRTEHMMDDAILTYVRDAVCAEIEYRRRTRELDRRLAELEIPQEVAASV